ncbi:MAG: Asd/ArgC dimerization domain-containing protein [Chitinophagales bacterium]
MLVCKIFSKKYLALIFILGLDEVPEILENLPGVIVRDNPSEKIYPMPVHAEGKDQVFVGRIRRGISLDNTLNC